MTTCDFRNEYFYIAAKFQAACLKTQKGVFEAGRLLRPVNPLRNHLPCIYLILWQFVPTYIEF